MNKSEFRIYFSSEIFLMFVQLVHSYFVFGGIIILHFSHVTKTNAKKKYISGNLVELN